MPYTKATTNVDIATKEVENIQLNGSVKKPIEIHYTIKKWIYYILIYPNSLISYFESIINLNDETAMDYYGFNFVF